MIKGEGKKGLIGLYHSRRERERGIHSRLGLA